MINIYNKKEIETLRQSGKILATVIKQLKKIVKPGLTTEYLNGVAKDLILSYNAKPSFEGFNGFPAALCTSINEEIVHGLPSKRKIKKGGILSLDLGVRYKSIEASMGLCTDMAITIPVGKIDKIKKRLIKVTRRALEAGIKQAKPGKYLGDIGWAIQEQIEKNNFKVVKELVGHGVGKEAHEDPEVLNFGIPKHGIKLEPGMVLALEPMASVGTWKIKKAIDGFAYKTKDDSLSAHFEHTIVITKKGCEILTSF